MTAIEEIASLTRLRASWENIYKKGSVTPGIDEETLESFKYNCDSKLRKISRELLSGTYKFERAEAKDIPKKDKTKTRTINLFTLRDKIVQKSIQRYLEGSNDQKKIFFPDIYNTISVGYLEKRSGEHSPIKKSVLKIQRLYKQGYKYITCADIKDFFNVLDRDRLLKVIKDRLSPDDSIIYLIKQCLEVEVLKKDRYGRLCPTPTSIAGVTQGSILSPLFSNIFMIEFDKELENHNIEAIRYADDLGIFSKNKPEAIQKYRQIKDILRQTTLLEFHADGTSKEAKHFNLEKEDATYLGLNIKMMPYGRWKISPSQSSVKNEVDKISEVLDPKVYKSLYLRISCINNSISGWVSSYRSVGCNVGLLKKIYSEELRQLYIRKLAHLLLVNKILHSTNLDFNPSQLEFLGVLPVNRIFLRKRNNIKSDNVDNSAGDSKN